MSNPTPVRLTEKEKQLINESGMKTSQFIHYAIRKMEDKHNITAKKHIMNAISIIDELSYRIPEEQDVYIEKLKEEMYALCLE